MRSGFVVLLISLSPDWVEGRRNSWWATFLRLWNVSLNPSITFGRSMRNFGSIFGNFPGDWRVREILWKLVSDRLVWHTVCQVCDIWYRIRHCPVSKTKKRSCCWGNYTKSNTWESLNMCPLQPPEQKMTCLGVNRSGKVNDKKEKNRRW